MQTVYNRSLQEKLQRETVLLEQAYEDLLRKVEYERFSPAEKYAFDGLRFSVRKELTGLWLYVTEWNATVEEVEQKMSEAAKAMDILNEFVRIALGEVAYAGWSWVVLKRLAQGGEDETRQSATS